MKYLSPLKCSGTKTYCLLTADSEEELREAAEKLHECVHGKGNQLPHLDLDEKKRRLALELGAKEKENA